MNDDNFQNFMKHGEATVKSAGGHTVCPLKTSPDKPMIVYRTYNDTSTAAVNLAYYYMYGSHRCNLMTDNTMQAGVYAYVDAQTAINKIVRSKKNDLRMVIGVVARWVLKHEPEKGRICLDPRSCKLLGFFCSG